MRAPFEGFDFQDFWEPTSGPFDPKEKAPPTADVIAEVEATFGVRLPAAYLRLLETQNGGTPNNTCFPTTTPTGWARDHVQISAIFPLGREHRSSLLGEHGAAFWRQEWGYPDFGICIVDTPSGGHEMIMLDYSGCGPRGEPSVVYVDQESDLSRLLQSRSEASHRSTTAARASSS